MKKILLVTALIFTATFTGLAQKYAFVDTEYILKNIPEYNDAQSLLDDMAAEWQKEIEEKYTEIDQLYKSYQAEAVLLPEEMKKKREEKVYNAIEELAVQQNYAIIFDKAGSLSMLYANEKFDLSDDVLSKLGYSYDSKE